MGGELAGEDPAPLRFAPRPDLLGRDPLTFDAKRAGAYERAAAFGLSHVLFTKSPGGVLAAAERTARFRPLVEAAVAGSGIDADTVEAIVFLESAGRPEVIAGSDPAHAAGLTQILAETAKNLLGMRVDLAASRRLTRELRAARTRGEEATVERLGRERRRVDARFDPRQALAGSVRYLALARQRFGRADLAVVSYHMGIGNLEGVLRAYAGEATKPMRTIVSEGDLSWARIYFDSSPIRHAEAWRRLARLADALRATTGESWRRPRSCGSSARSEGSSSSLSCCTGASQAPRMSCIPPRAPSASPRRTTSRQPGARCGVQKSGFMPPGCIRG